MNTDGHGLAAYGRATPPHPGKGNAEKLKPNPGPPPLPISAFAPAVSSLQLPFLGSTNGTRFSQAPNCGSCLRIYCHEEFVARNSVLRAGPSQATYAMDKLGYVRRSDLRSASVVPPCGRRRYYGGTTGWLHCRDWPSGFRAKPAPARACGQGEAGTRVAQSAHEASGVSGSRLPGRLISLASRAICNIRNRREPQGLPLGPQDAWWWSWARN